MQTFLNGYALNGSVLVGLRVERYVLVGYVLVGYVCDSCWCTPFEWIRIEWIRIAWIRIGRIRVERIRIGGIRIAKTCWCKTFWMGTHCMDTYWWDYVLNGYVLVGYVLVGYVFEWIMCGICGAGDGYVVGYVWCEICVGYVWCGVGYVLVGLRFWMGYVWDMCGVMDMCGICVVWEYVCDMLWCEIRQQSSEEPCGRNVFREKRKVMFFFLPNFLSTFSHPLFFLGWHEKIFQRNPMGACMFSW